MPIQDRIDGSQIELIAATQADESVLANLIELYSHDLSDVFELELGANGRYGYSKLSLYWTEKDRRFAFLIKVNGLIAGFALVTRGSPVSDDPNVLDLAEFFIVRRYRRQGLGDRVARTIWDRFAGQWTVRVSVANRGGCEFWQNLIGEYTAGKYEEYSRPGTKHPWRVFSFRTV